MRKLRYARHEAPRIFLAKQEISEANYKRTGQIRGRAILAPPTRRRRFGAGQLGAMPFRRRTFRRRFIIYFYFSSYEEKTMKQAIS